VALRRLTVTRAGPQRPCIRDVADDLERSRLGLLVVPQRMTVGCQAVEIATVTLDDDRRPTTLSIEPWVVSALRYAGVYTRPTHPRSERAELATLYAGSGAWKGFDWDAMERLHHKGYITDPVGKARSVVLTDEGLKESQRLFEALFTR